MYLTKVGSHTGGYDEWTVDITKAVEAFKKTDVFNTKFKGAVPISIRCDNSRDLETIPSSLSDFNRYGGLYRYVNLKYVPSLAIEKVLASHEVTDNGSIVAIDVKTEFSNTPGIKSADVELLLKDARGKIVDQIKTTVDPSVGWRWHKEIKKPELWSPSNPALYTLIVKVSFQCWNA